MGSNKKNKKNKASAGDPSEPPSLPPQDSNSHAKSNSKSKGKGDDVITDPRFSSVHWDPRFQNVQKHKAKVAVDSRFDRMFTDKRFGSASGPIDKRGKRKDPDQVNPLRSYYRAEEDEGKSKPKKKEEEEDEESTESGEEVKKSESESEEDDVASGGSESTTDSDTETDEEYEDDEAVFEDAVPEIQEENVPEIEKETHRLAIVNLDWDYVKAVDLYVVLRSFVPKDGVMKSVAVYPSEFGLQRMKEEETRGPVGLSDDDDEKTDEDDDEDGDDDDDLKVRAYIKGRLRYYFAVVECDSSATADYLYKNCDGLEFERSSNKLDLRFIPDSMEFKHPPRDIATEVPTSYTGLDFQTPGLQLTKCDVPFDQDDPGRKTLRRAFDEKQLDDLNQYMASSESESDESENDKSEKKNKKLEMYRTLLLSGNGDGDEDGDASDGDASNGESGDEGQHMEITFNTGLEDISKRILEKKDKESETVWEGTLRKRRERKKARKNRSKDSSEDESSDTDGEAMEEDDFFMEEPSVKKVKKVSQGKKSKKEENRPQDDKEAEASRNELELLLADDNGAEKGLKGYNLKRKKTKGKKGKEAPEEDRRPNVDLDDPRFSAVFTSSAYAVDPTDPQFQRNVSYARQVALRQSNGGQDKAEEEREVKSDAVPRKIERSALVKSLKMKTMPFAGKMSKEEENSESRGKKKEKKDKQEPHPTPVEPVMKKRKTKA